jgi:uncharacterized membrane protein
MQTRAQWKAAAKQQLAGKWTDAIILVVIYLLIVSVLSSLGNKLQLSWIVQVVSFIIAGPLTYAISKYFLKLVRGEKVGWRMLFDGFQTMMAPTIKLYLWMVLKVFLWSLLLIVPGIIKAFAYSQAFFLINDDNKLDPKAALAKSERMMNGHKGELFVLQLSFIGWGILSVLTLGIGYLWLMPYMMTTFANYYENLVKETAEVKTV